MDYLFDLQLWGRLNRGMVSRSYPSMSAHLQTSGGGNKLEPNWPESVDKINNILLQLKCESMKTYRVISIYAQYPELTEREIIRKTGFKKTNYYNRKNQGLEFIKKYY